MDERWRVSSLYGHAVLIPGSTTRTPTLSTLSSDSFSHAFVTRSYLSLIPLSPLERVQLSREAATQTPGATLPLFRCNCTPVVLHQRRFERSGRRCYCFAATACDRTMEQKRNKITKRRNKIVKIGWE